MLCCYSITFPSQIKGYFGREELVLFICFFKMKPAIVKVPFDGSFSQSLCVPTFFFTNSALSCGVMDVLKNKNKTKKTSQIHREDQADGSDLSHLLSENLQPFVILDAWLPSDALFTPDTCVL